MIKLNYIRTWNDIAYVYYYNITLIYLKSFGPVWDGRMNLEYAFGQIPGLFIIETTLENFNKGSMEYILRQHD